jgi:hypothetical protein
MGATAIFVRQGRTTDVNEEVLQRLQGLHHAFGVREALAEICRPYGDIVRIEVEADGDGAYICLVDLATAGQNEALCRTLGGFSYGRGVGFHISVRREY